MSFDEWLDSIIEISSVMTTRLEEAELVMNELGYTKEEQKQFDFLLK